MKHNITKRVVREIRASPTVDPTNVTRRQGEVVAVDRDNYTCTVTIADGDIEIPDVYYLQCDPFIGDIVWIDFKGGDMFVIGCVGPRWVPWSETIVIGDESTTITAGATKFVWRAPFEIKLQKVAASLTEPSTSGAFWANIHKAGVSIFDDQLTIDVNERTTHTAATPATFLDDDVAIDTALGFGVLAAGTGAKGLKFYLVGWRLI
jgi:hypothetical protein